MICLDTHVLIWLALDPEKLSAVAIKAIETHDRDGGLLISDISIWEISVLVAKKN